MTGVLDLSVESGEKNDVSRPGLMMLILSGETPNLISSDLV